MKKLSFVFGLATVLTVGFSSCAKNTCYECTHASQASCEVNICDNAVTATNCTGSVQTATTNEEIKKAYEAIGFTCTAK
ncbi:hypothetical protein [Aureispira anguillae]|uniref:Lipoprotein n=1 Tax=Aureispira anguillae TaxID=2864201 RepID=A0A915YJZ9_9BACT|nr:hypothetical protein [Aureispira anguillae]BDS14326.1 hypothetical protein AsAng_0051050 [Aureispira anguillae]